MTEFAPPDYVKAAVFRMLATFLLTVMTLFVRMLGDRIPVGETVFVRAVFAMITVVILFSIHGQLRVALRTTRLGGHFIRSLIAIGGMFSIFSALARLPVVEVTAITFVAPLLTVMLAALLLRERVRLYRWGAVVAGLIGGLIILAPRLGLGEHLGSWSTTLGALLALSATFCIAAGTIQVRSLTATESTAAITFYVSSAIALAGLATLPLGWVWPDTTTWPLLLGAGIAGALGQICITESVRYGPASFVAPFDYLALIWAFILGFFILGEVPTVNVVAGAIIVALAGLFVLARERRLGLGRINATPPDVP